MLELFIIFSILQYSVIAHLMHTDVENKVVAAVESKAVQRSEIEKLLNLCKWGEKQPCLF